MYIPNPNYNNSSSSDHSHPIPNFIIALQCPRPLIRGLVGSRLVVVWVDRGVVATAAAAIIIG